MCQILTVCGHMVLIDLFGGLCLQWLAEREAWEEASVVVGSLVAFAVLLSVA